MRWRGYLAFGGVALRKESVDRNKNPIIVDNEYVVALRKESVDRNPKVLVIRLKQSSLSARRAWIEISAQTHPRSSPRSRSPQGERG